MHDEDKSKSQLISELRELRQQLEAQQASSFSEKMNSAIKHNELSSEFHQSNKDLILSKSETEAGNKALAESQEALHISEQKHADAHESYSILGDLVPFGVWTADAQGKITFLSDAFLEMSGITTEGIADLEWVDQLARPAVSEAISDWSGSMHKRDIWEGEFKVTSETGREYNILIRGVPIMDKQGKTISWLGFNLDISNRKRIEEKLRQSQKMEAIGTLAGGIAHDFNNILYPLMGFTEMLKEDVPFDSPLHSHIDEILQASFRAKDLVKQILAFSRQGEQELKPIKLQPIIKDAFKLLRSTIPTTIDIQQDIDPECGVVVADPTQIHQIIMNLATNAYHAMEEKGGDLTVSLEQVRLEPEQVLLPELAPGDYARLRVTDTGPGIEKDQLDKIFDPYFTTKETGKGTGLGLSVVQGIVKRFHGDISVLSEPGQGFEVDVLLPVKEQIFAERQIDPDQPVRGGTEKILLVDDEALIVKMEEQMLERLGYTVTVRTGSIDALEAFKADPQAFDLVVTDMTMPNMTGVQLTAELKKIKPAIPVILCTGFSYQVNEEKSKALGIDGFVMKPVIMKEIAATIRKVLDNSS